MSQNEQAEPTATDSWPDNCSDAPIVSASDEYTGTLEGSSDRDHFRIELNYGEYLEVTASFPTAASRPLIEHRGTGSFTVRDGPNGQNADTSGRTVYLEPGVDGTYEIWAEETTTICFEVHDTDTDAGYPFDWTVNTTLKQSTAPDEWGDRCSDGPVIASTGSYTGTLNSPSDRDCFRTQLSYGDYVEVTASVPTSADRPQISHTANGNFTLREGVGGDNVNVSTDTVYLEPGFEGTYELWPEEDTTVCFRLSDTDVEAGYPVDWTVNLDRKTSASGDGWADRCDNGPIVDSTGQYGGTLVSPGDIDCFRTQLDYGEYVEVTASVPTSAERPQISHRGSGGFTLREGVGGDNVNISTDMAYLEPGFKGTYELWAEEATTVCFRIYDTEVEAGYPIDWTVSVEQKESAPGDDWADACEDGPVVEPTGEYSGQLVSPEDVDCFRTQLNYGEYITVTASTPTGAINPQLSHSGNVTIREGPDHQNASTGSNFVYLDPGLDGTYELWAEEDTTVCFRIYDRDIEAAYPLDWSVSLEKQTSAPPDEWADSCENGQIVESTGTYSGSLISPEDVDSFRTQLTSGRTLPVSVQVPTGAVDARVFHVGDVTLANENENVNLGSNLAYLDPGTEARYEIQANSDTTLCLQVDETDPEAGYPLEWTVNLGADADPEQVGLRLEINSD